MKTMVYLKDLPVNRTHASSTESAQTERVTGQDIAIIGMAGQLPGADHLRTFWENLREGVDAVKPFPMSREQDLIPYFQALGFDVEGFHCFEGAYLDRIDAFDPLFFNLSPKEASLMDPHQRLFLEVAWKAMEDAGYGGNRLTGTKTGVYVGFSNDNQLDYHSMVRVLEPDFVDLAVAGNIRSIIASRVSYLLDLKGPAIVVDTACSSTLAAVHIACTDLRLDRCETALVGGVKIFIGPVDHGQKGIGIRSSIDRARTFDNTSDGTGMGEGALALLLKPLYRAEQDGDHIYAVIKGSAVNQDGTSAGITAPNALAQADVIEQAWKEARINPETVAYMEAHGTGTILGDPIEIDGITRAFRRYTERKQFCGIGSVKTNIGHLDNAAGLAGLFKVALALHHGELPASIHFSVPNEKINFVDSPVYVVDRLRKWEDGDHPRRAGVSAFGLSGTNCHIVLEAAPQRERTGAKVSAKGDVMQRVGENAVRCKDTVALQNGDEGREGGKGAESQWHVGSLRSVHVLTLSGKSQIALRQLIEDYVEFFETNVGVNLLDLCYTANTGRGHYSHRLAIPCGDVEDLRWILRSISQRALEEVEDLGAYYGEHRIVDAGKMVKPQGELSLEDQRALTYEVNRLLRAGSPLEETGIVKLCWLYVQGAAVEWEELYRSQAPMKISLPTYPFERRRCWVDLTGASTLKVTQQLPRISGTALGHPLVQTCVIESLRDDLYVTEFSPETHWVLREHLVRNNCVIPGTTYLEMARVLGERYFPGAVIEFLDVIFVSPLVVNAGEVGVAHLMVQRRENHIEITIASRPDEASEWSVHAELKVAPVSNPERINYDLAELKDHCHGAIAEYQTKPARGNIQTGPRWRNVNAIYIGENELLMEVVLPDEFAGDLEIYGLHPAMLDMAVNVASQHVEEGGFYLPFSYQQFILFGNAPKRYYSYLRRLNPQARGVEVIEFDIDLLDPEGQVFGLIRGYRIKRVHQLDLQRAEQQEHLYYQMGWSRWEDTKMADDTESEQFTRGAVLIFLDRAGVGVALAKRFRDAGRRVLQVEMGTEYEVVDCDWYRIGHTEEDYIRLFAEVKEAEITQIVHMGLLREPSGENRPGMRECGYESLFYATRGLVQTKYHQEMEMICVADYVFDVNGTEVRLNPYGASLFGLNKVIGKEHAHLHGRALDLDDAVTVDDLLDELCHGTGVEMLAFRNRQRFVQEFDRLDLHTLTAHPLEFQSDGVYLITGGTGGLGLAIAKWLSARGPVKLALVNRTPLPPRTEWEAILTLDEGTESEESVATERVNAKIRAKMRTIQEMEGMGAEVVYYDADVADEQALADVLRELRQTHGRIRGVIHAAGVAGDGFIIRKDPARLNEVVAPKVQGTWVLDRLTREDRPDFMILFSSISSFFGMMGQGDYTAANSYLDAYAAYRTKAGFPTIVINWSAWRETGMAMEYGANKDGIFKALPTAKALAALEEILTYQPMRVTVGELDYEQVLPMLDEFPIRLGETLQTQLEKKRVMMKPVQRVMETHQPEEIIVSGGSEENRSETEGKVAQIWAKVLGLNQIDLYANFYELGGDSILATHLAKEMGKEFPGLIDISDIFNYSTVHDLAAYIERQRNPEPEQVPEAGKSDEEMEAILERLARGEIGIHEVDELLGR